MKTIMTTALASLLLVACSTMPADQSIPVAMNEPFEVRPDVATYRAPISDQRNTYIAPEDRCPPLPLLKEGATRFENRIWTLTIIGLYAQCAASK